MDATLARGLANDLVYNHQAASPWRGFGMDKCAQDLLAYQEIICGLRPALVVETGVRHGGSVLFLADVCRLQGHGRVIGIDIEFPARPPMAPNLTLIQADSVSEEALAAVRSTVGGGTLVILDSDHSEAHVLRELDCYSRFLLPGDFLVVEDTNTPGPGEALGKWLPFHPEFEVVEGPYISFARGGYLRRGY